MVKIKPNHSELLDKLGCEGTEAVWGWNIHWEHTPPKSARSSHQTIEWRGGRGKYAGDWKGDDMADLAQGKREHQAHSWKQTLRDRFFPRNPEGWGGNLATEELGERSSGTDPCSYNILTGYWQSLTRIWGSWVRCVTFHGSFEIFDTLFRVK